MPEKNNKYPKYKLIKDYVTDKIESKELVPGQQIPSENEFAHILNVSIITVRKAMSELVNEGIIYRVKGKGSFIAETPKEENRANSKFLALILSGRDVNDSSYMRIIKGIRMYLMQKDYSLIIEFSEEDMQLERKIIENLIEKRIDGFLLYSHEPEISLESFRLLKSKHIPFVAIDRFLNSFPMNYVAANNHDGAYEAIEYLLSLGHEKIAFVSFDKYLNTEKDRYEGYCNALINSGINIDKEIVYLDEVFDKEKFIAQAKNKDFTAVFAVNDLRALELLDICLSNGIEVPKDISIMGFDDSEEATKYSKIPLTTVSQSFEKIGFEAAKVLAKAVEENNYEHTKLLLPTKLIIRQSTARKTDTI